MARILVTGANGFIGKALCERLVSEKHSVIAAVRSPESSRSLPPGISSVVTKPLDSGTDWSDALQDADMVVHLAARVHVMNETAANPLAEFRRINLHGTQRLAQSALASGVKRFILLSTIGVNGNASPIGKPFNERDQPAPHNDYSRSKLEAELTLRTITANSSMQAVVLRAPLVYGPGNPGNALLLFQAVYKRRPLPFASVRNRRSLIYLGNIVDAIALCCVHPQSAGKLYLLSDGDDVSTPNLIRRIAATFGVPPRLFPFPPALVSLAAALLGKRSAVERLVGTLAVDSSGISRDLGWSPPYTMQQGLAATTKWYLSQFEKN